MIASNVIVFRATAVTFNGVKSSRVWCS